MNYRRLWISLSLVMIISFAILGYYGGRIFQVMPSIPDRVVTEDGTELFTAQDIKDRQNVWQSIGGQEVGSIWGHGAYVAPDWNADWLHREAIYILNKWGNHLLQVPFIAGCCARRILTRIGRCSLIVRHGQTAANVRGVLLGRGRPPSHGRRPRAGPPARPPRCPDRPS